MDIDELRGRIDAIDLELLELLEQRASCAKQIGALKRDTTRTFHDPEREAAVFDRLEKSVDARAEPAFPKSAVRGVFREVMSACLSVEAKITVAYLGPPGTFTHMAARSAFGVAATYADTSTIAGVFDAVTRGSADYGVVPMENSSAGGVTYTLDCLVETDAKIRRELVLDVSQCLLSNAAELTEIRRVYSHPQALSQCREWLEKHLPTAQLVVSPSTSAAAREASSDPGSAAVASHLAADLFGLAVIRQAIQDRQENATRFVVLSQNDAPATGNDRTTIIFSTPHEQGALRRVLELFDSAGINLSRIESRPSQRELWEYVFVTDIEGHRADPRIYQALQALASACSMVKVLGSYPRAT